MTVRVGIQNTKIIKMHRGAVEKNGGSKETWVWTMAMAMDSGHVIGIVLVTNVTI